MTIQELIESLSSLNGDVLFEKGLCNPHSYRGYYDQLGVEPCENSIENMISCLRDSIGETFHGWKGGDFTMHDSTNVYLAHEGCTGMLITGILVKSDCG